MSWEELQGLAESVVKQLDERGLTLAVAESCTGGLVAHLLTCTPGSSRVFILGAVTYADDMKVEVLQVDRGLIEDSGSVSELVANEMAVGCRAVGHTDLGVSTSGIAGPSGGSPAKPVGTVCFGLAAAGYNRTERRRFEGGRNEVQRQAAGHALAMVKDFVEQIGA